MTSRFTTLRSSHGGSDLRNVASVVGRGDSDEDDDEFSDFKSGLTTSSSGTGTGLSSLSPIPLLSKNLLNYNCSPVHQSKALRHPIQGDVGNRLANYNVNVGPTPKHEGRGAESCLIGDEDKYSPLRSFLQNEFQQTQESHDGGKETGGGEADFGDFQGFTNWDPKKEEHLSVVLPAVELPQITPIFIPPMMTPQVSLPLPVKSNSNPFPIESQPPSSISFDDFGDFVSFSKVHPNLPVTSPSPVEIRTETKSDLSDLFGLGISSKARNSKSGLNMVRESDGILLDILPVSSTDQRRNSGRLPVVPPPQRSFPFDGIGVPPLKTTLISGPTANDSLETLDEPFGDLLVSSSTLASLTPCREETLHTKIPKNENSPETLSVSSLDLGNYGSNWELPPDALTGKGFHPTLKDTQKASPLPDNKDKYNPFKEEQEREIQTCIKDWRRVLETCLRLIEEGEQIFHSVSSSEILRQVIQTEKGRTYVLSLRQVYLVACRVYQSWMRLDGGTQILGELHQKLALAWDSIAPFLVGTNLEEDFRRRSPLSDDDGETLCGICLVGTGWRDGEDEESWRLSLDFGGTLYHLPCANFWMNQVDSLLPSLTVSRDTITQRLI